MKPLRILPWAMLTVLLLAAFGPFTNAIQRGWPGVSATTGVINIAVSPTAQPTFVVPFNPSRYKYRIVAVPGATAFACCSYGPNSTATPAAVPTASGTNCATGMYIPWNVGSWEETVAPTLGLWCTTTTTTMNFTVEENK